jgi:titin
MNPWEETIMGASNNSLFQTLEPRMLYSGDVAMSPPTGLVAAAPTPGVDVSLSPSADTRPKVNLNWQDNSTNETGFQIFRNLDGGTFWNVANCPANSTSFVDTNVAGGYTYHYQVRATDGTVVSDFSNEAIATTPVETLPAAPSNLTGTLLRGKKRTISAVLTWQDNSTNEAGYSLQRSTDGVHWYTVADLAANTTSYTDNSLIGGKTFYYRVFSYNGAGLSGPSNTFAVTT